MAVNLLPQRISYPMGKCLRLDIPEEIIDAKIMKMQIDLNKTALKLLGVENAKVYFRDPNINVKFI